MSIASPASAAQNPAAKDDSRQRRAAALLRYAPFVAGALLIAGIVHLAAVLLTPRAASFSVAARFLTAEANVLAKPTLGPSERLPTPFADPSMVTALCRYDLEEGPVRLAIPTGEQFLSVVVLAPTGRVLLALTDRAATRRALNILLLTPAQQRQIDAQDVGEETAQDLRVRLSETKGVAVIRALALREADKPAAEALLARAVCRQE